VVYFSISGAELMGRMREQVEGCGVEVKDEQVVKINLINKEEEGEEGGRENIGFKVTTHNDIYFTKSIILATGSVCVCVSLFDGFDGLVG